ncbi:carbohydrate-binding protein [Roseibacillus persicicus]|uniref:carbohydrate-binding protein n=1 Tax=Roseibacillus persicicus TaxID=454148 RepID=UPI00398B3F96
MNPRKDFRTFRRLLLLATAISTIPTQAANVTWDGSESFEWQQGANWDNGSGPAAGDVVFINSGTVDFATDPGYNLRAIRLLGGQFHVSDGLFRATFNPSWDSHVEGVMIQTGGAVEINELEIGRTMGTTGLYQLSNGSLRINRALSDPSTGLGTSLFLGANKSDVDAGTGAIEISGGSFVTRAGIQLGDDVRVGTGNFSVLGSLAAEIGVGASTGDSDGRWRQYPGSTLTAGIDFGGVTPIFLHDSSETTSSAPSASFENGSLLQVGYASGFEGGGTWTVMEVENGEIVDNGLSFAPGVDTSVWSFAIDNAGANGLLTVTSNSTTVLRDVYWDGSEDQEWENPLNWTNSFGVFDEAYVHLDAGTIDYTEESESGINLRGFRMTGGTFNLKGGKLKANKLASAYSQMDGTVNHTGGDFDVNALELGRAVGSSANYELSSGELRIGRAKNGVSLYLGANSSSSDSGSGTFTISGGSFLTRTGVRLGHFSKDGAGTFSVLGSASSEIGIAGANTDSDGFWEQNSGSVLRVGIDFGGVTPIVLKDGSSTAGPSATFEDGALLDVDYYNLTSGGGTWVVMEVENGPVIDNGLAFAPGVDTSVWSFTIDNSGSNGRLLVSATGQPLGYALTIGSTPQQKMRYGMDYERLWYWTGGLSGSERDQVARWSAVDADIDFVRVAINSKYELTEGSYDLSAYTSKIIPLMQEMKQANPNIKFFASPRPLNEAYPNKKWENQDVKWQPYPIWVTGASDPVTSDFDFKWEKCAEYLERYILLMKSYGFKISFLDLTNEWQDATPLGGSRIDTGDARDITNYLKANLDPEDMPLIVTSSAWNYAQGTSWINAHTTNARRDSIDIAASHNTDRGGDAQTFADKVRSVLGPEKEIWNTEVHGWKSTSSENETTSFYYYLEAIRAGFSGINGWLAIGTANQGHSYILNPSGSPTRNVKYYIYRKLSSTSNYGHALDILEEPGALTIPLGSNDDDIPRTVAAFIKGNLMTVWVVNESSSTVPLVITPSGRSIAESNVRRTRWTDPSDVEGFETFEPVFEGASFASIIPAESVCCFEIVLDTEDFSNDRIEAEDYSHAWDVATETTGDSDGDLNVGHIRGGSFTRYGGVALEDDSVMTFRLARPAGRPDGVVEIREGSSTGNLLGTVPVPVTGNWQSYETVSTQLDVDAGIYNLYLNFVEASSSTGNFLANFNWFTVNEPTVPEAPVHLTATPVENSRIDLTWDLVSEADSYTVLRSTSLDGTYDEIANGVTTSSFSDSSVVAGVSYFYVVRAVNAGGESANSPVASASLLLAAPISFTANKVNASRIDLGWGAVSGATSYLVKRATMEGGPYATIASGVTATSYSDLGSLTPGSRYYYVATASSGGAESAASNEASAVPSDPLVPDDVVIESLELGTNLAGEEQVLAAVAKSGLGQFYQVMGSEDLTANSWSPVSSIYQGNGGLLEIDFAFDYSTNSKMFFRLEVWTE